MFSTVLRNGSRMITVRSFLLSSRSVSSQLAEHSPSETPNSKLYNKVLANLYSIRPNFRFLYILPLSYAFLFNLVNNRWIQTECSTMEENMDNLKLPQGAEIA